VNKLKGLSEEIKKENEAAGSEDETKSENANAAIDKSATKDTRYHETAI
jgi:hypothetical protein